MERLVAMIAVTTVVMLALGVPGAWAEGKVHTHTGTVVVK